jgi:hypothetical protein
MRKLAREAVIFMLVGLLLATFGTYGYLRHERVKYIQAQRNVLQRECVTIHSVPLPGFTLMWDRDGKPTSLAECDFVFGDGKEAEPSNDIIANDKSYESFKATMSEAHRIKDLRPDIQENAVVSLVGGGFGFAGGLVLWAFYRLVRFAVKG